MRLKYALTIGDPKSAQIVAYQARETGNSHLTKTDIVTALGLTQARQRFGLSLLYAKYTKDVPAGRMALDEMTKYTCKISRKYVGKIEGRKAGLAIRTLCSAVLEDYCRTIDTPGQKCRCGGSGEVVDRHETECTGILTLKACSKCKGTGLKPFTRTSAFRAISVLVPNLSQSTWSRRWNGLYDALLSRCYEEEAMAERIYRHISGLVDNGGTQEFVY